jgi:hypothetical protein
MFGSSKKDAAIIDRKRCQHHAFRLLSLQSSGLNKFLFHISHAVYEAQLKQLTKLKYRILAAFFKGYNLGSIMKEILL